MRIRLGRKRANAEALLLDTARVEEVGTDFDPETGLPTYTTVYEGKAKRQTYEGQEANPEVAGSTVTVQRYRADFPVGAFEPKIGQRITWLTSVHDPYLPGKVERVVSLLHKTAATAYRLGVEEGP